MARAGTQNQPVAPYRLPTEFNDDLATRAFPHRFRRIGSPFAYLNDIGIGPIIEYISKGHLLIEVAEATNVPLKTLQTWVEQEGHYKEIDEAETASAEGVMAKARRAVAEAPTEFELRRAKVMLAHAEWMASKKNKPLYGDSVKGDKGGGGVSYTFNINGQINTPQIQKVIESTAVAVEQQAVRLDLEATFSGNMPVLPTQTGVLMPVLDDPTEEKLRLVADRPTHPTAQHPDIGPFYEEIEE